VNSSINLLSLVFNGFTVDIDTTLSATTLLSIEISMP